MLKLWMTTSTGLGLFLSKICKPLHVEVIGIILLCARQGWHRGPPLRQNQEDNYALQICYYI